MRVLQAINSLGTGGAEKLILESVPLYQKNDIEVDILLLKDNISVFRSTLENNYNIKVFGLTKRSIYNPLLIFKIIPYLNKYDVVHAHLFPTLYWIVLAKWLSFSKTKIIYTEHGTHNRRRDLYLFKWIDRIIYSGSNRIITIANEVDIMLKDHLKYKNLRKFQLINNGVNISNFTIAEPLPKKKFFSNDDIFLIQVSSFKEPKDQPTLIQAMKFLPENIKLLLVGDGPLKVLNEKLTEKLDLNDRIKFLGIRYDIPKLLKTSDIVILSSKHEGMSLSSIEGMSVKPFIAANASGLKEVVSGYGLLFEIGNSEDLADKVLSLTADSEYYNEIAQRCAGRAKEFDIDRMVEQYTYLYKTICSDN